MHTVESATTLDFSEWDVFIDDMITNTGRDAVFNLVANDRNLPRLDDVRALTIEQTERFPIRSLVTNIVVTDDTLNVVGSPEDFLDRETWRTYGMELSLRFVYLSRALRRMEERRSFDNARLVEAIESGELFSGRSWILAHAAERYYAGDYISFLHVALPQVEEAVRSLVRRVGRRVTVSGRDGQMELKPLGALLASLRGLLDEDLLHFLEFALCHRQGWNLRNGVMHGVAEAPSFCQQICDVVLWIVLRLSLLRVTVEPTVGSQESSVS
jgi:hypothetical protein